MNKKGFTLTELIAVFAILAFLTIIAYPSFSNISNSARSNYDSTTQLLLKNAATIYVNNNMTEINNALESSDTVCIPVGKLIAYEYLDSDFKDSTGNTIEDNKCINISKQIDENNNIKYIYDTTLNDTIGNVDYLPPVIKLTGTNCKTVMNLTKEEFLSRCSVTVTDNQDTNVELITSEEVNEAGNKVTIEYNATDSSGNKALPLTIKLNKTTE